MKIYISVDMEGMAGICSTRQETDDSARFRKAYEQQVAWVIEGIQQSVKNDEIEEITISDSHGYGRNLSYDLTEMDERITLISGSPRPHYMMCGLDETYDIVFLVGYHCGIGDAAGNMEHTVNGYAYYNVMINDQYMNESTISAAYAGYYGVPVGLVIGDTGLKKQLHEDRMLPHVNYVTTKESISRMAAKYKAKAVVRRETIEAVKQTLEQDLKHIPLYTIEGPYKLEIDFTYRPMADAVSGVPGAKQEARNVIMNLNDYIEVYDALFSVGTIAMMQYPFDIR